MTHVNQLYKDHLPNKWSKWMTDGESKSEVFGNEREHRTRCLLNGSMTSMKVAISYAFWEDFKEWRFVRFDGHIDSLHSSLAEVITKVKEFLIQLEEESDEKRCNLDNSVES